MAEILIKLGNTHPNPKAWQRLYPVAVKPNGHVWGNKETWPHFARLRITDMTVEALTQYLVEDGSDVVCPRCTGSGIDPIADPDTGINGVCRQCNGLLTVFEQTSLRKFKIDLDDITIPQWMKNRVTSGQTIVAKRSQVVNFIKRTIA